MGYRVPSKQVTTHPRPRKDGQAHIDFRPCNSHGNLDIWL